MTMEIFRVRKTKKETYDTVTLELKKVGKTPKTDFLPGQFNMLYAFGVGEVPISISGDPEQKEVLVHTVRIIGFVTKALGFLKAGDSLGVRGPFGNPWPVKEAQGQDVILAVGGLGLAPMRPAIYHLISNRKKYGKISLLYGARTPEDILYKREFTAWKRHKFDIHTTVDNAGGDWKGNVGVVTNLVSKISIHSKNTTALVCGPEIMMRFTIQELMECNLPREKIFLSMERNMKCGIGICGHCQIGPTFACKDGPVYRYDRAEPLLKVREM